ncbi:hypothetical protein GE061_019201 [Apolygus lucorum]|uniref:Uncharacterized protein n=1 Tax=Apolygus lucorum TaxID=248454 RepID=A0A6A4JT53_APOLU|nr:hypothetical protein GE061_019201 [Apolygus lucorum]
MNFLGNFYGPDPTTWPPEERYIGPRCRPALTLDHYRDPYTDGCDDPCGEEEEGAYGGEEYAPQQYTPEQACGVPMQNQTPWTRARRNSAGSPTCADDPLQTMTKMYVQMTGQKCGSPGAGPRQPEPPSNTDDLGIIDQRTPGFGQRACQFMRQTFARPGQGMARRLDYGARRKPRNPARYMKKRFSEGMACFRGQPEDSPVDYSGQVDEAFGFLDDIPCNPLFGEAAIDYRNQLMEQEGLACSEMPIKKCRSAITKNIKRRDSSNISGVT